MGNPVVHFEIIGKDVEGLCKFYGDLFGWEITVDPQMGYGVVNTQAATGINGGIGASPGGGSYVTFYMAVDNLEESLARVEQAGGKTTQPPTEIPNVVTFAQFTDPVGNLLGLVGTGTPPETSKKPDATEVGWFEIIAPTLEEGDELAKFYTNVFGWKGNRNEMGPSMVYHEMDTQTDGAGTNGGVGNSPEKQKAVVVYAGVPDVTKALEKAKSLGGTIVMPEMQVTEHTIIGQFNDPEGHRFGLYKNMPH